jgi:hypothetical protein
MGENVQEDGQFTYYKLYSTKSSVEPKVEVSHDQQVAIKAAQDNLQYAIDNGYLTSEQVEKYGDIIISNILRDAYIRNAYIFAGSYMVEVYAPGSEIFSVECVARTLEEEYPWSIIIMNYYKTGKGQPIHTEEEEREYNEEELKRCEQQLDELYKQKAQLWEETFGKKKEQVTDINRLLTGM